MAQPLIQNSSTVFTDSLIILDYDPVMGLGLILGYFHCFFSQKYELFKLPPYLFFFILYNITFDPNISWMYLHFPHISQYQQRRDLKISVCIRIFSLETYDLHSKLFKVSLLCLQLNLLHSSSREIGSSDPNVRRQESY